MVVVACNSATSAAGDLISQLAADAGVPVVTVIRPEAEIAAAITESGRVGVLATPATVSSGAYHRALEEQGRPLTVTEVAAPDLAPIIQQGFPFDQSVMDTVRGYCEPLRKAEVDTLILGCTHYPLVAPMLQRFLGRDVRLVTAGHAIAAAVQRTLAERGELAAGGGEGGYRFLVTGDVDSFVELGTRFLQLPLAGRVEALRYA
jgi:glutamate racemase